jgi:SM-20-related protein
MHMGVATMFDVIIDDLRYQGYSIQSVAIDQQLAVALHNEIKHKAKQHLTPAGIGRNNRHTVDKQIRSDHIEWIDNSTQPGMHWLAWVEALKVQINRKLFLGLDEFESHYAYYPQGAFYRRHKDAFIGESNRILSVVAYLNPNWCSTDGGELVLYQNEVDTKGIKVQPILGTLVIFLSEEFPHEVLPAERERYSIAGWFRQKSKMN